MPQSRAGMPGRREEEKFLSSAMPSKPKPCPFPVPLPSTARPPPPLSSWGHRVYALCVHRDERDREKREQERVSWKSVCVPPKVSACPKFLPILPLSYLRERAVSESKILII